MSVPFALAGSGCTGAFHVPAPEMTVAAPKRDQKQHRPLKIGAIVQDCQ